MSFIIMTARIMVNVLLQKSLLEQKVGSVFMQEVITGGALRICHIIQIQIFRQTLDLNNMTDAQSPTSDHFLHEHTPNFLFQQAFLQ